MILEWDGCEVYVFHIDAANRSIVHSMIVNRHILQVGCNRPLGGRWHIGWGGAIGELDPQWHIKVIQDVKCLLCCVV